MTTQIYQNKSIVATRYIKKYPFPNDISLLPSVIPGIILQADFDASDTASLTRNRVGNAMTVVGTPELSGYGVNLSETNYLDTGIDIANYNSGDLTMVLIAKHPGVAGAAIGRIQLNAPQRSRGLQVTATAWRTKWLTASGAAQQADIIPSTANTDGDFIVSRFVRDNGSGSMLTKIDLPRTAQSQTGTAATSPYTMPSSNMLIGASVDTGGTWLLHVRAALIVSRAITDVEMATVYSYYKNYYQLRGVTI